MLAPVRVLAPSGTPISLAEAKAHLRVDHADDDAYVSALIDAATAWLDGWSGVLGRALRSQRWRQDFGCFPGCARGRLALLPTDAIVSITYFDRDNAQQTLASEVYAGPLVDEIGAYFALNAGQSWPDTYSRADAVSVTYSAGYGAASDVPAPIRQAMLLLVGHWYAVREAVNVGNIVSPIPFAVDALLAPYRRIGL